MIKLQLYYVYYIGNYSGGKDSGRCLRNHYIQLLLLHFQVYNSQTLSTGRKRNHLTRGAGGIRDRHTDRQSQLTTYLVLIMYVRAGTTTGTTAGEEKQ